MNDVTEREYFERRLDDLEKRLVSIQDFTDLKESVDMQRGRNAGILAGIAATVSVVSIVIAVLH